MFFSLLNENDTRNVVEVTKSSLTDTEKSDGTSQTQVLNFFYLTLKPTLIAMMLLNINKTLAK